MPFGKPSSVPGSRRKPRPGCHSKTYPVRRPKRYARPRPTVPVERSYMCVVTKPPSGRLATSFSNEPGGGIAQPRHVTATAPSTVTSKNSLASRPPWATARRPGPPSERRVHSASGSAPGGCYAARGPIVNVRPTAELDHVLQQAKGPDLHHVAGRLGLEHHLFLREGVDAHTRLRRRLPLHRDPHQPGELHDTGPALRQVGSDDRADYVEHAGYVAPADADVLSDGIEHLALAPRRLRGRDLDRLRQVELRAAPAVQRSLLRFLHHRSPSAVTGSSPAAITKERAECNCNRRRRRPDPPGRAHACSGRPPATSSAASSRRAGAIVGFENSMTPSSTVPRRSRRRSRA